MQRPHRKERSLGLSLDKRLVFLGRNSGIHGLGHLFRENAPFFDRLFWLVVLLVSLGCLYLVLLPLLVHGGGEVSYTAETRFLPWTTTFPAVTVCEIYISKEVMKLMKLLYPDLMAPLKYDLQRYLTELAFGNKLLSCTKSVCEPCGVNVPCNLDWRKLIDGVHRNCTSLLTECKENGKEFDCCTKFRLVDSETGPCYSYNTLQSENPNNEPLFSMNRSTGPGHISFRVLTDVHISVHSTEELSTSYMDDKLKFEARVSLRQENKIEYTFSLVEFENDPLLEQDNIEKRGCRYLHEVPDEPFDTYRVYSYGACKVAHDTEHAFEKCGCVHPARDLTYRDKYCDFDGLNCLVNYETGKNKLGHKDHDEVTEVDPCVSSCVESELTKVHLSRRWVTDPYSGINVTIQLASLPSLRFERNLLRSDLDLVVSVGGMVGLFFGASIFSLVEIFYLFMRKQN